MGGMLMMAPALIGAGSSLAGLFGGSPADNVKMPNMFQMPNMGGAADSAFGTANNIAGMPNVAGNLLPQYSNTAGMLGFNNPGAGGMLAGAQAGANMGGAAANNNFNLGGFLSNAGASMMPYAGQVMNAGFDPQSALYDRTQHQLQEQVRASNAASGTGMSPFGAGVENKAMSDFNIDWQNNALSRMLQGAQGAGSIMNTGQNAITGGQQLQSSAPGLMQNTSAFPYQAFNTMGGDMFGALNQYSQAGQNALAQPQQSFTDYLSYLQAGNQSGQVANQTGQLGLNQAQLGFNQNQTMGANLGKSLGMLGGQMGGSSGNAFLPSASFMSGGMGWG